MTPPLSNATTADRLGDDMREQAHPFPRLNPELGIPNYLHDNYWWAYLHPRGVKFFDRLWMVNLILFGNFNALRDAALLRLGPRIEGNLLQIAAVYGDITPKVAARLAPGAGMTLVDIAPIQLANAARKLSAGQHVTLLQQDSTAMTLASASFDTVLLFFLLHEQPDAEKRKTCAEALRLLKPGGRILVVDYHRPRGWNPMRYLLPPLLRLLEPFSMALWAGRVRLWFPEHMHIVAEQTELFCGGLYQVTEFQL